MEAGSPAVATSDDDHLSGEEDLRRQLKARYLEVDRNGDGSLDMSELAALLRQGRPDISQREIRILFQAVDQDASGRIDFEEFVEFIFVAGVTSPTGRRGCPDSLPALASRLRKSSPSVDHQSILPGGGFSGSGVVQFQSAKLAPKGVGNEGGKGGGKGDGSRPGSRGLQSRRNSLPVVDRSRARSPSPPPLGPSRKRSNSPSTVAAGVSRATEKRRGPLADALANLFEALDPEGWGSLTRNEINIARQLLTPLVVGGEAAAAAAPYGPKGQALPGVFESWALHYLGAFDCPSDEALATKVMELAMSIKPPFAPWRDYTDDDLDDVSEILSFQLFISSARSAADEALVTKRDISHIVSVGKEYLDERPHGKIGPDIERHDVNYLCLDVDDQEGQAGAIYEALKHADEFIDRAVRTYHRVLVHCDLGVSGSPAVVMAYLVAHHKLPLRGAFEYVRKKRPVSWPSCAYMQALLRWEAEKRKPRSVSMSERQYRLWSKWAGEASTRADDTDGGSG